MPLNGGRLGGQEKSATFAENIQNMPTVKAYYDGAAFVPVEPMSIQRGELFMLSIRQEKSAIYRDVPIKSRQGHVASLLAFASRNRAIGTDYHFSRARCYDR
jgi:hypothetical protein